MPKTNLLGSILLSAGVPLNVLRFAEDYKIQLATAFYTKDGENKSIPINKQQAFLEQSNVLLGSSNRVILIYSSTNINCARAIALRVFIGFINSETMPVWHFTDDSFGVKNDELITALKIKPHIPFVVLDDLSIYMSVNKCEKVTRILRTVNCPIILIMNGKKPFTYCQERLGITPNFIIRAENSPSKNNNVSDKSERI